MRAITFAASRSSTSAAPTAALHLAASRLSRVLTRAQLIQVLRDELARGGRAEESRSNWPAQFFRRSRQRVTNGFAGAFQTEQLRNLERLIEAIEDLRTGL